MGTQYSVGRHTFENRRESVILYDGDWYNHRDDRSKCLIFGNTGEEQSVELDKEFLGYILAWFDDKQMREKFCLVDAVKFAKQEIESEEELDDAIPSD